MFAKILIANRGEIACRVIRTARRMGIATVAVFSDADATALHVQQADEAVHIGPAPARESYLRIEKIIDAAKRTGAQAIHPGYGFLSENPAFVEACDAAGIVFVGPPASAMRAMGSKAEAKRLMEAAGVPLVPGYHGSDQSDALLEAEAARIGFPVLIKASAGGGGRGMRAVGHAGEFATHLTAARREAEAAFGDGRVLIEKYLQRPRHIEVQVLADTHGTTIHLGTRDCSIQRRHQKIIEEAPAPGLADATREKIHQAAIAAARACGYVNAGTIEFIAEGSGADPAFFFMEMNTRLQVEHPVTEAVFGVDLVALQLRVAAGEKLPTLEPPSGHAIEVRLCAEDPDQEFRPSTGRIGALALPPAPARVDTGVRAGDAVSPYYDSMIAKIIAHDADRETARRRLASALGETGVLGPATNLALLRRIVAHRAFAEAELDTGFIARHQADLLPPPAPPPAEAALAAAAALPPSADDGSPWTRLAGFRLQGIGRSRVEFAAGRARLSVLREHAGPLTRTLLPDGAAPAAPPAGALVLRDGDAFQVTLPGDPRPHALTLVDPYAPVEGAAGGADRIAAPIPGLVARVDVTEGDAVVRGQVLAVLEAMKTEIRIAAPADGTVAKVLVRPGQQVQEGVELVTLAAVETTP